MKTPEEIKKGLEACRADECHGHHTGCPYDDDFFCIMHICGDALAYIEQMEKRASINTMRDAISRSAVLDRLEMLRMNYGLKAGYRDAMTDAIGEVSDALAIGDVPVVLCKDCKRWGAGYPSETDKIKCCQIAGYLIGENGYCLYAEAKDTVGV